MFCKIYPLVQPDNATNFSAVQMRSQFLREQGAGEAGRRGSVASLGISLNPLHAKFKVLLLDFFR
jgi:hypothetical protein